MSEVTYFDILLSEIAYFDILILAVLTFALDRAFNGKTRTADASKCDNNIPRRSGRKFYWTCSGVRGRKENYRCQIHDSKACSQGVFLGTSLKNK